MGTVAWDFKNPEMYVIGKDESVSSDKLVEFYNTISENNSRIEVCNFKEAEYSFKYYQSKLDPRYNFLFKNNNS